MAQEEEEKREKQRERGRRYYEKNKDKVKKAAVEWKKNNQEKVREGAKIYRDAHKDELRAVQTAWAKDNPEKVRAKSRRHYEANKEICRQRSRDWYASNKDTAKQQRDAYRSRLEYRVINMNNQAKRRVRSSSGKLSPGLLGRLFALQKGKCACCGFPLGDDYHLDHIMPLALGGLNEDSNMQLLRAKCNLQKHAMHPIDYMQSKGFLL